MTANRHQLLLPGRSSPTSRGPEPARGRGAFQGICTSPAKGNLLPKRSTSGVPSPPEPETQDKRPVRVGPLCLEATHTDPATAHRRPEGPNSKRPTNPQHHAAGQGGPQSQPQVLPQKSTPAGSREETKRPIPWVTTRREPEACPAPPSPAQTLWATAAGGNVTFPSKESHSSCFRNLKIHFFKNVLKDWLITGFLICCTYFSVYAAGRPFTRQQQRRRKTTRFLLPHPQ